MKHIILKSILALAACLLAFSCSKEYLNTVPEDSTSPATIFETTGNAKLAINGISRLMTVQYMSNQGYNGEGTIMSHYGNWPGNDLQRCNNTGNDYIINSDSHDQVSYYFTIFAWFYYYKLINNANQIIANIGGAEGPESERQFIKAQALTYRAYCYFMLSQIYCYRWDDRNSAVNEGVGYGLPYRGEADEDPTGPLGKTKLEDIYANVYKDLDQAIELYKQSGLHRAADEFYLPDVDVAYAVYARASLTRQDWAKAAPVSILIVADETKFGSSDARAKVTMGTDAGIVSENINLFCAGMGLVTRPRMTMDVPAIKKLLKLSDSQVPLLNNPVGYAK